MEWNGMVCVRVRACVCACVRVRMCACTEHCGSGVHVMEVRAVYICHGIILYRLDWGIVRLCGATCTVW